ncbi:MAG TPA: serine/threonine-protein kinase, partial [Burkholderiales bacterium]|nr:serine/threonine-protein kinase [Burkholderiales bacterium]
EVANALPSGYALHEYRIESVLGAGGFGLTYLATDSNLSLKVALKEYLPGEIALRSPDHSIVPTSEETAETFTWGKRRFLDESRTLASFRHPNIVRVMRFFEANGSAYMVMEFVEGAPLSEWIKTRRPLPEAALAALARPLLEGLEVVHKSGYTHRDIKPGNIYVREDSTPVLLDFGSARMQASELTAVVSPGYAPFEQYHTQGRQGPWSDLYALAGVLYWMVIGSMPQEAPARIRADAMAPAVQAGDKSRFRPEFLAAIDWGLTPFEDQRPQSVAEWRQALLAGKPVEPRTQKIEKAVQPARLPADVLKRAEQRLAEYIGPVAGVVVKRAAAKARDEAELYLLLADEIEDKEEKKAFVRKAVSVSGKPRP